MLVIHHFGNKWVGWIHGVLLSSKALIFVNWSPTIEFALVGGLR